MGTKSLTINAKDSNIVEREKERDVQNQVYFDLKFGQTGILCKRKQFQVGVALKLGVAHVDRFNHIYGWTNVSGNRWMHELQNEQQMTCGLHMHYDLRVPRLVHLYA